ncbi:MAG: Hsp20/alpha crystallin family protein [Thermodesulfobacteriota bacterium]
MLARLNDIDRMFGTMGFLHNRLDHFFHDSENDWGCETGCRPKNNGPRTNFYDHGDAYEVSAEVPGLAKEDLDVKVQGNTLEISGSRQSDTPEGYSTHRNERGVHSFSRSFTLPADINAEKVVANLGDGILTLTLPKAEVAKARQITIA